MNAQYDKVKEQHYEVVSTTNDTEPMRVLFECVKVLRKKGQDYQNPNSRVKQAMYYPHGLTTIMDIIEAKRLRLISLIEAVEADATAEPNFESIEDSFKDMANYCAIATAWCRGKIVGQDQENDILNRPKQKSMSLTANSAAFNYGEG